MLSNELHPFHLAVTTGLMYNMSHSEKYHKDRLVLLCSLGPVVSSIMHEMKNPDRARVIRDPQPADGPH